MQCLKPFFLPGQGYVPCGRCIECRIARSKEWTARILHEKVYWEKSSFLTLTYAPEKRPEGDSLNKKHYQLFVKRLRKELDKDKRKLKYYACGEYGELHGHAHFHAIMFGVGTEERKLIQECWPHGFIHAGVVEHDSVLYVVDYINKRITGPRAAEAYGGRTIPFSVCSQGIGQKWLEENKDSVINRLGITINGVPQGMPRYYRKKLGEAIPEDAFETLKIQKSIDRRAMLNKRKIDPLSEAEYGSKQRLARGEAIKTKQEMKRKGKL